MPDPRDLAWGFVAIVLFFLGVWVGRGTARCDNCQPPRTGRFR